MGALSVLADPTRHRIVEMLACGVLSSGEIASRFDASAPAISQHLRTLREARLVRVRAQAQKRIYELDPVGVGELSDWVTNIRALWSAKLEKFDEQLKKRA